MLAASYWSLLAPAIEIAESSPTYGPDGRYAFVPAAVGFTIGAFSMHYAELILPLVSSCLSPNSPPFKAKNNDEQEDATSSSSPPHGMTLRKRKPTSPSKTPKRMTTSSPDAMKKYGVDKDSNSFRRILLLVIAITVHNFPEGMAVGVGFGSIGQPGATFQNAFNLAIGIGLQNFPEGLAVSMPLRREGMSAYRAFMWGQLSGVVEPIGGVSFVLPHVVLVILTAGCRYLVLGL